MSTANSVRVSTSALQLAAMADGRLSGSLVVEVADGVRVQCSGTAGLQMQPTDCAAGKTTLTVTAPKEFAGGTLKLVAGTTTMAEIKVTALPKEEGIKLLRKGIPNGLELPLPKQPEDRSAPKAVLKTPFEEVALVRIGDRTGCSNNFVALIDVFSLRLWTWQRYNWSVRYDNTVRASDNNPKVVCIVGHEDLLLRFSAAAWLNSGVFQYIKHGNSLQAVCLSEVPRSRKSEGDKSVALDGSVMQAEIATKTYIAYRPNGVMLGYQGLWNCLDRGDISTVFAQECDHLCGVLARDANLRARAELQRLGRPALPFIASLLRPQSYQLTPEQYTAVRLAAAAMLAESGDSVVLTDLWWAAFDPCPKLRKAAAQHLARFPAAAVREIYVDLLRHIDDEIRMLAAAALQPSRTDPVVRKALLENATRFPTTAAKLMDAALG